MVQGDLGDLSGPRQAAPPSERFAIDGGYQALVLTTWLRRGAIIAVLTSLLANFR